MTSHRPLELTGRSILLWDGTELSIGINGNGFMLTITAERDGEPVEVDQLDMTVRDIRRVTSAMNKVADRIERERVYQLAAEAKEAAE